MACKAITKNDTQYSRNALLSGYCSQHDKDAKIKMYKKELSMMHQRVRKYLEISNDLTSRTNDIKKIDYRKAELIKIGGAIRPFRAIIDNPFHRDEVDKLFGMDIALVLYHYNDLLNRRNSLVHPFTMDGMNGLRTQEYLPEGKVRKHRANGSKLAYLSKKYYFLIDVNIRRDVSKLRKQARPCIKAQRSVGAHRARSASGGDEA